jgi:hypothetical protein
MPHPEAICPCGLSLSVCPETLRGITAPSQRPVDGGDVQEHERLTIETLPSRLDSATRDGEPAAWPFRPRAHNPPADVF